MYCIDCCRASAAPLASGSANKYDLFLSHKVLHRSNITRVTTRFKYVVNDPLSLATDGGYVFFFIMYPLIKTPL